MSQIRSQLFRIGLMAESKITVYRDTRMYIVLCKPILPTTFYILLLTNTIPLPSEFINLTSIKPIIIWLFSVQLPDAKKKHLLYRLLKYTCLVHSYQNQLLLKYFTFFLQLIGEQTSHKFFQNHMLLINHFKRSISEIFCSRCRTSQPTILEVKICLW